ncbi:hypothetical protein B5V89_16520 [Heyndrickxia sporothermodurans]|nr:hypothetical protein B5V89_16520 [Heyndrickxia sporothermodurans]
MEGSAMESIVQDHEKRILALEKNYADLTNKMQAVETGQLRIEKTLLEEGKEQKNLINEQKSLINKQREEQEALLNRLIEHTLNIKQNSSNKRWDLALAIFGGGGLIFGVLSLIFK